MGRLSSRLLPQWWLDWWNRHTKLKKFAIFFWVVIFLIPILVFSLSSVFAFLLWVIECAEQNAESDGAEEGEATSGTAERRLSEDDAVDLCSYYEWFKYIVGNLVGVGLSDVEDGMSGHVLAEIIDLIVSTWSLALTGGVVGLVGGLGFMTLMTEALDGTAADVEAIGEEATKRAAQGNGLDFSEFEKLVNERRLPIAEMQLKAMFKLADADNSGRINAEEVTRLMDMLEMAVPPQVSHRGGDHQPPPRDNNGARRRSTPAAAAAPEMAEVTEAVREGIRAMMPEMVAAVTKAMAAQQDKERTRRRNDLRAVAAAAGSAKKVTTAKTEERDEMLNA